MIPSATEAHSTATTVAQSATTRMSIDQSSLVHLMSVLTNLYSDPISAVIREYSTNGLDSHIEAGLSRPVKVTLPSAGHPFFSVQDFGVGLSVDDLQNVYSLYGASTKRQSEEAVGMLGLGCKSAFTYAEGFAVTSVKNGVKVLASIAKDDDGIGCIRILDTFVTDEPNGVTVSIPVRSYDIFEFQRKAETFFSFWKSGTVLVNGEEPRFVTDENTLWLDEDICVIKGYKSYIVQGNVAYPFQSDLDQPVVAWVPMGSVNFTPSREALHMTSRTKETIATISAFARQRFEASFLEKLNEAPTAWDKIKVASAWNTTTAARTYLQTAVKIPSPAYVYAPGRRGNSRAIHQVTYRGLTEFNSGPIITGFPFRNVGPAHKARLRDFTDQTMLILPAGSDLSALQGRSNTFTWQDVLDDTPQPEKAKREKKVGNAYVHYFGGQELNADINESLPIVWVSAHKDASYLLVSGWKCFPEAQIVPLRSNQEAKFLRLFPKAVTLQAYGQTQRALVAAAIKESDKIAATPIPYSISILVAQGSKVNDPRFRKVAKVTGGTQVSDTVRRARLLGVSIPQSSIYAEILADYPLLGLFPSSSHAIVRPSVMSDTVAYVNFKYTTNNQGASK